jgi:hypothetical protein
MYDSVLPPDRRRYCSDAGGIPSAEYLRNLGLSMLRPSASTLAADLAQSLLFGDRTMVDVAGAVECACVCANGAETAAEALAATEPPRSPRPVVDLNVVFDWSVTIPRHEPPPSLAPDEIVTPLTLEPALKHEVGLRDPAPRTSGAIERAAISPRRTPPGGIPLSRDLGGRPLPRAYVARRRTSPTGVRRVDIPDEVDTETERVGAQRKGELPSAVSLAHRSFRIALVMGALIVVAAVLGFSIGLAMR